MPQSESKLLPLTTRELFLLVWVLASRNRRAENVEIEAVVIAELKLRNVQRQMFSAHLAARPIGPAIRIQRGV